MSFQQTFLPLLRRRHHHLLHHHNLLLLLLHALQLYGLKVWAF